MKVLCKPELYIDLINMTIFVLLVLFSSLNNYRILGLEESRSTVLLVRTNWRAGSSTDSLWAVESVLVVGGEGPCGLESSQV